MKEKYSKAEMEFVLLKSADVLTNSPEPEPYGEGEEEG